MNAKKLVQNWHRWMFQWFSEEAIPVGSTFTPDKFEGGETGMIYRPGDPLPEDSHLRGGIVWNHDLTFDSDITAMQTYLKKRGLMLSWNMDKRFFSVSKDTTHGDA